MRRVEITVGHRAPRGRAPAPSRPPGISSEDRDLGLLRGAYVAGRIELDEFEHGVWAVLHGFTTMETREGNLYIPAFAGVAPVLIGHRPAPRDPGRPSRF